MFVSDIFYLLISLKYLVDSEIAKRNASGARIVNDAKKLIDMIWPSISDFLRETTEGKLFRDKPESVRTQMIRSINNWLHRRKKTSVEECSNLRKQAYKIMSEHLLKRFGADVYKEGLK